MRQLLINKLIELGYDSEYIYQKLDGLNIFNENTKDENTNDESINNQKHDIQLYLFNKPTVEIPRAFLKLDESLKEVLLFDGTIEIQEEYSPIIGNIRLADYKLDKELCLLCITYLNEIKILKYIPNNNNTNAYINKTYEQIIKEERESLTKDYLQALTANQRVSEIKAKEILYILVTEYVVDKIIIDNLNPKIKLYDDAKEFSISITNYKYKYINKEKNLLEAVKKEITTKMIAYGTKIGNISNEPYLGLNEVNQNADFRLDKPSYVWMTSNHKGKEELAIYTANAMYSAKSYQEWINEREDLLLKEKVEELTLNFSKQVGYSISKNSVLEVLKKLNRELIVTPETYIINNIEKTPEQIETLSYHYTVVTDTKEFESLLYVSLENHMNGIYRYQFVENLNDNYTLIGKRNNYTDLNGNLIQEQSLANFNINAHTAVLRKITLVAANLISHLEKNDWDMLPIPRLEVVFYFPKSSEMLNNSSKNIVEFYHELNTEEREKKMAKVYIFYVSEDGTTLKDREEISAWIGEKFTPEVQDKITDKRGLMWKCILDDMPTISVKENENNVITLIYDKLNRKVKIEFIDEDGNQIRDAQEEIYQVGDIIKYDLSQTYTDSFGKHWKARTLDRINQKVYEEEDKNVVSLIYKEQSTEITISYFNELGQKIMKDKVEEVQIGSDYEINQGIEVIDDKGKYWVTAERQECLNVKEDDELKISVKCRPIMSKVSVKYVNEKEIEILPSIQQEIQVGETYIPNIVRSWQGEDKKSWIVSSNQLKEFKIKKDAEENNIIVKYEPVLVNATIQFQNLEGKEIKTKKIIPMQLGSEWNPVPDSIIKDEKGNEWQLVDNDYKAIVITENEKLNVITHIYQVAKAEVSISYMSLDGEIIKQEEHLMRQVGNAFIPTPEQILIDKENRKWKLHKVQPAMLKVKSIDNKIIVTYQPENTKVIWQYIDTNGNELKSKEEHIAQVGMKYTPIVSETTIQKDGEIFKLINIEPYEKIISEDERDNIIKLIYVKVSNV